MLLQPETAAAQAGADIEVTADEPPGGQAVPGDAAALTTSADAQNEELPVDPGTS